MDLSLESRVPVKFSRDDEKSDGTRIFFSSKIFGGRKHKDSERERANAPLTKRCTADCPLRLDKIFGDKRILELRGVSPTAARVKPGAFSGFCDDWTARTLTPARGMPQHRAVGSRMVPPQHLDTFRDFDSY